jgi:hypothetical protein
LSARFSLSLFLKKEKEKTTTTTSKMSSIFGGGSSTSAESSPSKGKLTFSRDSPSPIPHFGECVKTEVVTFYYLFHMATADLNARKEAVMSSVRNELALANAQELINVRATSPIPASCIRGQVCQP